MAISAAAHSYAEEILSSRRLRASIEADKRKKHAISAIPELGDVLNEIPRLGIAAAMNRLSGGNDNPADAISALKAKAAELLKLNGFEKDYLENVYRCPACKDQGVLPGGERCSCYIEIVNNYNLQKVKSVSPLTLCDFCSFSLDYYSDAFDAEMGCSARENMQDVLDSCRAFVNDFPYVGSGLLMVGDAGLGKTHLALSIANDLIKKGFSVMYGSAPNIFKRIEAEYFDNNHATDTLDALKGCELLVLDDLGAEFVNAHVASTLYDLLNTRISKGLPSIFTSNLTDEHLFAVRYGEKISSRLLGCCKVLPFFGEDIRLKLSESL